MLLVQLEINTNSWCLEICQIGLAPAGRPILAKFPNITRTIIHLMSAPEGNS
jgi:hypothetical protein